MHKHLIDWFREVHLHPDQKVVERRWETAGKYVSKLSRADVPVLLRTFLFEGTDAAQKKSLTDQLLALDSEFPVSGNDQELRLMAGVIMVSAFSEVTSDADALALGLKAAMYPGRELQPSQPAIVEEAVRYLLSEADNQRSSDFDYTPPDQEASLTAKYKALKEAEAAGDAAKIKTAEGAYVKAISSVSKDGLQTLSGQIRRLAEESAILWWVFGQYSLAQNSRTTALESRQYALVAANEAADRTHIMPPPRSMDALLGRALQDCKGGSDQASSPAEYASSTLEIWRKAVLQSRKFSDCLDLLPMITTLAKYEESGDVAPLPGIVKRLCPGVDATRALPASSAAQQFYNELMFLKALAILES